MKELHIKNIDKLNWNKYRFEEIAESISERVEPQETDLDIYVGLEHLDADSLHIRRTGVPGDVTGTKLKVYKGDIIFGKRRAYQRKAAIAHFDGICSAHAMVLRAKSKVIDPKLFPFFLHSDYFMHRAIDISVGGLSPTINWGTLKTQEFLLPPKDQQDKLAELLWAGDDVENFLHNLLKDLNDFKVNVIESFLSGMVCIKPNEVSQNQNIKIQQREQWEIVDLKRLLLEAKLGGNYENDKNQKGLPLIKMGNLGRGEIVVQNLQFIPEGTKYSNDHLLQNGDLLFNTRNTLDLVGKVAIWKGELPKALFNSNIMRLKFDPKAIFSNDYMNIVFNSKDGISQLRAFATGTTSVAAIYQPELLRFKVPLPSLNLQRKLVNIVNEIKSSISKVRNQSRVTKQLQKSLIKEIFS